MRSEGLTHAQEALARWHTAINQMLSQGVESGDFAERSVAFVPTVLETLSWHMVNSSDATERTVDDAVEFLLAAVLSRRGTFAADADRRVDLACRWR